MKFVFGKSSVVVVGTFNIYIVQPSLLKLMGVFDIEKVLVSGDLTQPGIKFSVEQTTWVVRPDRLAIETTRPEIDCGSFAARTLSALHWTPIKAIGINSVFTSDEPEEGIPDAFRLPIHTDAIQRSSLVSLPYKEGALNIQISKTPDRSEVSLNLHFDTGKREHRDAHAVAKTICETSSERIAEAEDIVKQLLHLELER